MVPKRRGEKVHRAQWWPRSSRFEDTTCGHTSRSRKWSCGRIFWLSLDTGFSWKSLNWMMENRVLAVLLFLHTT